MLMWLAAAALAGTSDALPAPFAVPEWAEHPAQYRHRMAPDLVLPFTDRRLVRCTPLKPSAALRVTSDGSMTREPLDGDGPPVLYADATLPIEDVLAHVDSEGAFAVVSVRELPAEGTWCGVVLGTRGRTRVEAAEVLEAMRWREPIPGRGNGPLRLRASPETNWDAFVQGAAFLGTGRSDHPVGFVISKKAPTATAAVAAPVEQPVTAPTTTGVEVRWDDRIAAVFETPDRLVGPGGQVIATYREGLIRVGQPPEQAIIEAALLADGTDDHLQGSPAGRWHSTTEVEPDPVQRQMVFLGFDRAAWPTVGWSTASRVDTTGSTLTGHWDLNQVTDSYSAYALADLVERTPEGIGCRRYPDGDIYVTVDADTLQLTHGTVVLDIQISPRASLDVDAPIVRAACATYASGAVGVPGGSVGPVLPGIGMDIRAVHFRDVTVEGRGQPEYPSDAREHGAGRVRCTVGVLVNERGEPSAQEVGACPRAFHEAARAEVDRWHVRPPYDLQGQVFQVNVPVVFDP